MPPDVQPLDDGVVDTLLPLDAERDHARSGYDRWLAETAAMLRELAG